MRENCEGEEKGINKKTVGEVGGGGGGGGELLTLVLTLTLTVIPKCFQYAD